MSVKLKDLLNEIQTTPLKIDGDRFEINGSIYNINVTSSDCVEDFIEDISAGDAYEIGSFDIIPHLEDKDEYNSLYFQKDYDKFMGGDVEYKTLTKLTPVGTSQAIKVLSTVGHYMIHTLKDLKNFVFHFSADTSEPSRVRLYDRLSKIVQARTSLKLYVNTTSSQRHYFLYD